jgi:divalent metal cation (Fe/Co/Zn/Cd) transporter
VIIRQGALIGLGACRELTDASAPPQTLRALERALDPLCTPGSLSPSLPGSPSAPAPGSPHTPSVPSSPRALDPLCTPASPALLSIDALRARRAGARLFVDLTARVRPGADARALVAVEERIGAALRGARRDVGEVSVRFRVGEQEGSG